MSAYNRFVAHRDPLVVVTHWVHQEVLERLGEFCRPLAPSREEGIWDRETVGRQREAQGLMVCMADQIDEEMLASVPRLRVVAGVLKGHDNIDVAACARHGVWVTVLPDLLTAPTAELVVGLLVAVMRRLREGDAQVRSGGFRGWRPQLYGRGLDGATVGLVGMGQLGQAVARRVQAFDARVVYCDPRPDAGAETAAAERLALGDLLAVSDVVVPLVPLTADTHHLLDGDALAALRPGTFVVNAGRGSVVDEEAVAAALEEGRLGGYAADVFAFEDWSHPSRPRRIPPRLLAHPATVFTPHLGSAVDDVRRRMGLAAAGQVGQALAGQRPDGAVDAVPAAPPRGRTG
jgi:phosphonate dehydrogenase